MQGYSGMEVFTGHEIALLAKARDLVEQIPEDMCGEECSLRCHELARAVGFVLDLPVSDGKCGPVEHSWCWTRSGRPGDKPGNILDVYAVGRLPMVQLVGFDSPGSWGIPNRELYRCYPFPRTDIIPEIVHELLRLWGLPVGPTGATRGLDCTGANGPAEAK